MFGPESNRLKVVHLVSHGVDTMLFQAREDRFHYVGVQDVLELEFDQKTRFLTKFLSFTTVHQDLEVDTDPLFEKILRQNHFNFGNLV